MLKEGYDILDFGEGPRGKWEHYEGPASPPSGEVPPAIPPEGEPILKNWWRLSGLGPRVGRWWKRFLGH
jgi:hypothetical protein